MKNEQGEPMGMCWNCEISNKVSKEELIDTLNTIKNTIHHDVYLREHFNTYPDGATYNASDIREQFANVDSSELKTIVDIIVAGAVRRREEDTPDGKHWAALSARVVVRKVIKNPFGGKEISESTKKQYVDHGCGKWIE
jgi:hypothetical protein